MLRYPGRQLRIEIIGKRNDRRFGQMTVFRNVIARQYTKRGEALAGGVSVALRRSVRVLSGDVQDRQDRV